MVQAFHSSMELRAVICRGLDIGRLPRRTQLFCAQGQKGGQIWPVSLGHKYSRKRTGKGDSQGLKGCWAFSHHTWKHLSVCAVHKTRAQKKVTVAGTFNAQSVVDIY